MRKTNIYNELSFLKKEIINPERRSLADKAIKSGFFLLLFAITNIPNGQSQTGNSTVKCYDGEITIPVYPWWTNDDLNPPFRRATKPNYSPCTTTYPYAMQDNLSREKVDKTYKTMIVENEYLKVIMIPELGGHIHSVIDKTTNENVFYENKVIKPSLIGLRGAWASGGIEFNTGPQGHTVTCLSPVEAKFIDFADGSKGFAVGNIDQIYHTQWVVTVRLRPGRAFLEEQIRIYNPTENRHIYYFWNCVAMPNSDSTQFIYPMTLGQDHWGKTFFNWPVNDGKDISWLKNFAHPTSVFSYRCDQDFYGSYDHKLDRGAMAYANHYELEGKKSWTWSKGQWGLRAQESLTDDGSCYNEIQTGPMPTQADYGLLDPHLAVEWKEWWYPVRGTKGVAFSNKDVTVNIKKDQKKSSITLMLHGTGVWDATCSVEGVGIAPVKISPEKPVTVFLPCKSFPKEPYHISIKSGNLVLADFIYPLQLPKRIAPANPRELPSENTAAGCWLRGIQYDKEGNIKNAREYFEKAILKDTNFAPAMTSLAELETDAGQFEDARKLLEKSIKFNPDDGWAMYYLAQSYNQLGMEGDAMELAYHAARRPESSSAAYNLAGTILLKKGEFEQAADALRKAVENNGQDIASRDLLAFALWKTGNSTEASNELAVVQTKDPLDIPCGIISALMGKNDEEFTSRIAGRNEEVMDAAVFFYTSGLKDEAAGIIKKYYIDGDKKKTDPMIYYYYGILANDAKYLISAMEMNPDYVFPNHRSDIAILQEVIQRQPKDWKARYYLGNVLFERAREKDAQKVWKEAAAINDSYSVLNRNLGLAAWKTDKDAWTAVSYYEKALRCNPNDFALYRDLGILYIDSAKQYNEAVVMLEKAWEKKFFRADIASLLGRAYLAVNEPQKALDMLIANSYTNWEGQSSLYTIYTDACLGIGKNLYKQGDYEGALKKFKASVDFPLSLGPGKMDDNADAESRYWIGMALDKLGKPDEAAKEWKIASGQTERGNAENKKFAKDAVEKLSGSKVKK